MRCVGTHNEHELWQIATDAVINYAIGKIRRMQLPRGCVDINELEQTVGITLKGRSAEQIYAILKTRSGNLAAISPYNEADPLHGDVHEPQERFSPEIGNESIEQWGYRTTTAAGSVPGLIERLRGDIPKVTTPWNTILRSFVRRFCGTNVQRDYRRPHRRWLSMQPIDQSMGIVSPIHYGNKPGPAGRLAMVADTSGSIDAELLGRFTAEIISLMRQTQAHVRLIVADAAVHQVEDFVGPSGIERLRHFAYRGGGGTDFAPAIAAAAAWKPDALVYLTDLFGNCGTKPTFPVLWAVCPGGSIEQPPFGQRIDLQ